MERVYTNYTIVNSRKIRLNDASSIKNITKENIRLIFNETKKDAVTGLPLPPLTATGSKENIHSVSYDSFYDAVFIQLTSSVPEITSTDDLTVKIDMGDDFKRAVNETVERILGVKIIDCEDGIPACDMGEFGYDVREGDMDHIVEGEHASKPAGFGVGSIVRTGYFDDIDMYEIATAVDEATAGMSYFEGELYINGATWAIMKQDTAYVCKKAVTLTCDDVEGEPFSGTLYVYEEFKPETVKDLGEKIGDYVEASDAEYAAFKTHMQTEIANILTPITEEEE